MRRFSRVGAAQLFPSFKHNTNLFSDFVSKHSPTHIGMGKGESLIKQMQMNNHKTAEVRGFPTRDAQRRKNIEIRRSKDILKPSKLKYDLAERIRSRTYKTIDGDDSNEDGRTNDQTYRTNIKLRRKRVILEEDDPKYEHQDSDEELERRINNSRGVDTHNTIPSAANYFTAATGNRNTVLNMNFPTSRMSSVNERDDD